MSNLADFTPSVTTSVVKLGSLSNLAFSPGSPPSKMLTENKKSLGPRICWGLAGNLDRPLALAVLSAPVG